MSKSNKILNPQARQALTKMKYEIASSIGVDYNSTGGYLGDITARQAGKIGGEMVRNMIAAAQQSLVNQTVAGTQASFSQALNTYSTNSNSFSNSNSSTHSGNMSGGSNSSGSTF